MTETIPVERLAVGDRIGDKRILSVGFNRVADPDTIMVAYQDPYTPPDVCKHAAYPVGTSVEVETDRITVDGLEREAIGEALRYFIEEHVWVGSLGDDRTGEDRGEELEDAAMNFMDRIGEVYA
jgi:hypothetical protein